MRAAGRSFPTPVLYSGVGDVTDCDNLQFDLNAVHDWASSNNMYFNKQNV